jgi:hypothetical protein
VCLKRAVKESYDPRGLYTMEERANAYQFPFDNGCRHEQSPDEEYLNDESDEDTAYEERENTLAVRTKRHRQALLEHCINISPQ